MEYTSYKDYLRKTRELEERQVRRITESEGQKDTEYLRMIENEIVEQDERAESEDEEDD